MFRRRNELAEARQQVIDTLIRVIDAGNVEEQLSQAKVEIASLKGEIALKDEQIKHLKSELTRLTGMQPSSTPLYWTEEEEEAKFWLDRGLIDKSQYEDMLAGAGFLNTEVEFAPEDYPRLSAAVPS
jgi:hypothetical protein